MVGSSSSHLRAGGRPLSSPARADSRLLFWRGHGNALALHLVDDRLGALVAFGGELRGLAGEPLELLTQLDRLLHGGFLQPLLLGQRVAVVDRIARLERHQHKKRHGDNDDSKPPYPRLRQTRIAPGHHHGVFPAAAGAVFSAGPLVEGTGSPDALIVIPLSASRSRSLSSLLLTAVAASARISASLMRPSWVL